MEATAAFNATAVFTLKRDRVYRVFLTPKELYFIWVGAPSVAPHVGIHFGLVGMLIAGLWQKRSASKREEQIRAWDERQLDDLLLESTNSFRAAVGDFTEASIEPPSIWGQHGIHVGRWKFALNDGSHWLFQFDQVEDMRMAVEHLPKLLGDVLQIQVAWDERKKRFVKRP